MQLRLGLTGQPRIGKSTLMKKVIAQLKARGVVVGGMLTADIHEGGQRVGFSLEDIRTGEKGILAHVQLNRSGLLVGKYTVNLTDLDRIGTQAITEALARPETQVLFIDEIGPMELKSRPFVAALEKALASDKHLILTVHQRSAHELVQRIKHTFQVIEVTKENRDDLPAVIMEALREITNHKHQIANKSQAPNPY
jgi:nucleoside-triphosphatase